MHHLIYLSQATRPLSAKALTCVLDQARQANVRQHLTGVLVYDNKRFLQLLEGEQAVLAQVYARLSQDPRHQHLCLLAHYPIAARQVGEWPLAFRTLSPAQLAQLVRYFASTKSAPPLPAYGSQAPLFVEALRALVQSPTIFTT